VFLKSGSGTINLENQSGEYSIKWFDPRNGGKMQTTAVNSLKGGKIEKFGKAPTEQEKDWVVLVTRKN